MTQRAYLAADDDRDVYGPGPTGDEYEKEDDLLDDDTESDDDEEDSDDD